MTLNRGRTVRSSRSVIGAVGLAAAASLAVAACGSDNTAGSSPSSSSTGSASTSSNGITCATGSLTASGSTAQTNAMSAWTKAYQSACSGSSINYQGGGSGKGYTDFVNGTDDFAGSDYALSSTQKPAADSKCGSGGALDLPMTPGAIAIGYNLPGVTDLKLSAANLASIFSGKITKWNDSAITKDNPGVNLPSTTISTFHRSDTSGTSFNFSNYLTNDAKSSWTYGANKQWPAPGGQGSKGTAGIAQGVKSTEGGIGYMEESYATQNSISVAEVGDSAGNFVKLSNENTTNFLSHAKVTGTGDDLALTFDYTATGTDVYPNVLVTYEFVCASGNKSAALLKGFLGYTSGSGQSILTGAGYVPLPSNIQTQVQTAVAKLS